MLRQLPTLLILTTNEGILINIIGDLGSVYLIAEFKNLISLVVIIVSKSLNNL